MSTSGLWNSLKISLFIQRVYCLSPFYLSGSKLQTPWPIQAYIHIYLAVYIAIIAISVYYLQIFATLKQFLPSGFMWIALSGCEFFLTNITFVLVVVFLNAKRIIQMNLLHRIATVDNRMHRHFGVEVNFWRLRRYNNIAWIVMLLYYQGFAVVVTIIVIRSNLIRLIPFVFAYQFQQATASGFTFLLVNYMLILRARIVLVRDVFNAIWKEYAIAVNRRQKDAVLQRLSVTYQVFKELCELVQVIDGAFGLVALVRIAHEFTLLNTQLYLVFWIARDVQDFSDLWYIVMALVWMLPNVIKIGCTTVTVESTLSEVF